MDDKRGTIYKAEVSANDSRRFFIDWIENDSRVLDVGCACGDFAKALLDEKNATIYGMEYNSTSIQEAKKCGAFKDIFQVDLNNFSEEKYSSLYSSFDYISFGDVLEHLNNPTECLLKLKKFSKADGTFLISLPNVAHASVKANLLLNRFDYTEAGILDKTHMRFFTHKSIAEFATSLELKILEVRTTFAKKTGSQPNNPFKQLPDCVNDFILKDPHSSIMQYAIKCRSSIEFGKLLEDCNYNIMQNCFLNKKNVPISASAVFFAKAISGIIPFKSMRKRTRSKLLVKFSKK